MLLGRYATEWKAARAKRALELAGDTRKLEIREVNDFELPFVLHASVPLGTDVPVPRDGWPGLETGPQDVHGGDDLDAA